MDNIEKMNQENEIDLLDLLRVFWRWRLMIAGVCMVCTLLTLAITSYLPKVYRITTVIEPGGKLVFDQNGQIVDQKIIVSPVEISDVLIGGIFNKEIAEKLVLKISDIPKIKTKIIGSTNILEISIESRDTQKGLAIVNEVISKISSYVQIKFESDKMLIESKLKACENEYQDKIINMELEKERKTQLQNKMQRLEDMYKRAVISESTDSMLKFLYSKEILDKQIYLNSLIDNIKRLDLEIKVSEIKLTELKQEASAIHGIIIRSSPTIDGKPVKPKILYITTAVFFSSLILSIIIALILERFRPQRLKQKGFTSK
ncbi:MAG: hypothetical protein KJ826_09795 [Proteobacteria bacterium]|nr:hypothetical protein [Pseudomonadota bacterium]